MPLYSLVTNTIYGASFCPFPADFTMIATFRHRHYGLKIPKEPFYQLSSSCRGRTAASCS